ncbi:MAG: response regulator transcription factor [Methylotenera sp.]|nr:response regulator transcription factor [Methylotenera sp.]
MKSTLILLIDDHAMFRQGIRMVLNKSMPDTLVLEAGTMSEAFTKTRVAPSIILLDVQLPGLNGIEGLGMLKKSWPDTPVIVLSSHLEPDIINQALVRGAFAFISKVESAAKIIEVIQTALCNNVTRSDNPTKIKAEQNHEQSAIEQLTKRQCEVLDLLCQGLSNKLIARRIMLSEFTVRGHVQAILRFLQVSSRSEAVFAARRMGMID